jgi:hypothetical protein
MFVRTEIAGGARWWPAACYKHPIDLASFLWLQDANGFHQVESFTFAGRISTNASVAAGQELDLFPISGLKLSRV